MTAYLKSGGGMFKLLLKTFIFAGITLLLISAGSAQSQQPPSAPIALVDVRVVDIESGEIDSNHTVLISGNQITRVAYSESLDVPSDAKIIDAGGKYVIPGLWDMHSHTWNAEDTRSTVLPLNIAYGVVGIRNMAGDCHGSTSDCANRATFEQIQAIKDDIESEKLIGPRIYQASAFLDGNHSIQESSLIITDPEEARQVVKKHKESGFDMLKVYAYLMPDVYYALVDEAANQGIPFAGHVPWTVTVMDASNAGQKSMEHGFGLIEAASGMEDTFINERIEVLKSDSFTREDRFNFLFGPEGQVRQMIDMEEGRFVFVDSLFQEVTKTLIKNETWLVPTLTMNARGYRYGEISDHDLWKYLPKPVNKRWQTVKNRLEGAPQIEKDFTRLRSATLNKMIKNMHQAGVGLLAGTDCDVDLIVPGYHLHKELHLFVEAGLSPLEALQTATLNAARYFGKVDEFGTIEEGKRADLILLQANPLDDISNTLQIEAIIHDGEYMDRHGLDTILSRIEK